jgi:glutamate-1-semialdehyde 2,1-aminomutase
VQLDQSIHLFKKSQDLVPGGVHSPVRNFGSVDMTPIFIKSSDKERLFDEDGNDYIDFCMSFGPLIMGHRCPQVLEAVHQAIERGWSYGACEKYSLDLAQFIIDRLDFVDQIRFVNSGTEAVMTSLRIARGVTGKNKILKFNGCYHGHVDSMLIKSGSGLAGQGQASSSGISSNTIEETIVCELNDRASVEQAFAQFGDQIAAIIFEPQPANYGLLDVDFEFLRFLRQISSKHHSLLIFDEVISGFRFSFGGVAQQSNIVPDLVTYGKIIGGGFPVGAVAGTKNCMQALAPAGDVYQAGTLSANPLAMQAGLANLKLLTPEIYSELNQNAESIQAIFQEWLDKDEELSQHDMKLIRKSSLLWFHPKSEKVANLSEISPDLTSGFNQLFLKLIQRGVYLAPNAYEVGFVSAAHNRASQDQLKERLQL